MNFNFINDRFKNQGKEASSFHILSTFFPHFVHIFHITFPHKGLIL